MQNTLPRAYGNRASRPLIAPHLPVFTLLAVFLLLVQTTFAQPPAVDPPSSNPNPQKNAPTDTKPTDTKPTDTKPTDTKPKTDSPPSPSPSEPKKPNPPPKKLPPATSAPKSKWTQHDLKRPRPQVIAPPAPVGADGAIPPPGDAIVLFDGKNLDAWAATGKKANGSPPNWKIESGYMEVLPGKGSIVSRDKFASSQIHLEWVTPAEVKGAGQGRGNSGVHLGNFGELQILDSFDNDTYPDGQAAALYGRFPPRVNVARKPGEWQSFDIILELAELDEKDSLKRPARMSALHNGVLVHHAVEMNIKARDFTINLQDHGNPVRYRNIWIRPLQTYPE